MEIEIHGFISEQHSIEPSTKPQFAFGAKRPNDINEYRYGKITPPTIQSITPMMKGFRFEYSNNPIIITTYIHKNTLFTLLSLNDIHLISYPNPENINTFITTSFDTSSEKEDFYLSSARGKLVQTAYNVSDSIKNLKKEQTR